MHAKRVVYISTLVRTLQAGTENINPLRTYLGRSQENLGPFYASLYCMQKVESTKRLFVDSLISFEGLLFYFRADVVSKSCSSK